MPTSSYMPDVVVEIAFNSGWSTPAASRTWTDVSAYVELGEGITITGGRSDERSTTDANQLTLTLDNSDGRFTSGLVTGPYNPLRIGHPIRVRATPVDGAVSTRFLGYVNAWPTEWDGTAAYAKAPIAASSRLARLGGSSLGLKSIIETYILADSPIAYYTMGEPADSTQANDSSGSRAFPLLLAGPDPLFFLGTELVFGTATGPATDGLTAVTFAGGGPAQYLSGGPQVSWAAGGTMECFVLRTTTPIFAENVMAVGGATLGITTSGFAVAYNSAGTAIVTSGSNIANNATHHLALTISAGGTWTLYVDGVSAGSAAGGTPTDGQIDVAGIANMPAPPRSLTGVVAHLAVFSSVLTAPQILAHATAGTTGYAGETTSARLIRYAALAGIAAAEVNAETGSTTVQHVDTTDKAPVELMRIMETTEQGVLYDERDGTLTFHNRAHRNLAASAYTLNMTEGEVEQGYSPMVDLTALINVIHAQDITGVYTADLVDATSRDAYGYATASIETASQSTAEPLGLASWLLYVYKDPKERVPNLEVDALAQVGRTPNCAAVMATTVGTKITVAGRPAQAATSSIDHFAEGWTETYGHESLKFSFNLSPASPWGDSLILSDGTRGFLGTNPLAF